MRKGFNLMELLVGMGLLGVLLASVNTLLMSSLTGSRKSDAVSAAESEGKYAMAAMEQMIKFSSKASCTTGTNLQLVRANGDIVNYSLTGARIASNSSNYLTSTKVAVSAATDCGNTMFTCSMTGGITTSVDVCYNVDKVVVVGAVGDVSDRADVGSQGIPFKAKIGILNAGN